MQFLTHYFLHLLFPLVISLAFFRPYWLKAYLFLLSTMFIDLDHLLASPIFSADRCSIGFHPLHSGYALLCYVFGLLLPKWFRVVAIGLLLHLITDLIDCLWMYQNCADCVANPYVAKLLHWLSTSW